MAKCERCEQGHAPRADGYHYILKSMRPEKYDLDLCGYHKLGEVSPLMLAEDTQSNT